MVGTFPIAQPVGPQVSTPLTAPRSFQDFHGTPLSQVFVIAGPYGPCPTLTTPQLFPDNGANGVNHLANDSTGSAHAQLRFDYLGTDQPVVNNTIPAGDQALAGAHADSTPTAGADAPATDRICMTGLPAGSTMFQQWTVPTNSLGTMSLMQVGAYGTTFSHYTTYAATYIYSPIAQTVTFNWAGDDCAIIWVNGHSIPNVTGKSKNVDIYTDDTANSFNVTSITTLKATEDGTFQASLGQGINYMLIKLTNGDAGMKFAVWLDDNSISQLKFSPTL